MKRYIALIDGEFEGPWEDLREMARDIDERNWSEAWELGVHSAIRCDDQLSGELDDIREDIALEVRHILEEQQLYRQGAL